MNPSRFPSRNLSTAVLFKVDIAGGTRLKEKYRPEEIQECLRLYHDAVERVALESGGKHLSFQGDGAVSYFIGDDAVGRAIEVAFQLQESVRTLPKYELHLRIAIGVDDLPEQTDFGKIVSHQFNLAGHAEKVCPADSVAITEEGYLSLERRPDLAEKFEYYGTTIEDRAPVFVAPRGRPRKAPELFVSGDEDSFSLKSALLNYYRSPEFRMLQFRGVRQFDRVGAAVDLREAFVDLKGRPLAEPSVEEFDERWKKLPSRLPRAPGQAMPRAIESAPRPLRETLRSRCVILLGDPGSGKTTFLRWVTLVVCDGTRSSRRHLGIEIEAIPLFIRVGRLWSIFKERQDGDVLRSIVEHFKGLVSDTCLTRLPRILERDDWIFLLDGLDEIPDVRDRPEAARLVERMMTSIFPRSRFVVTSRVIGYPYLNVPDSSTMVLEPLEKAQAEDLARHFYEALLSRDQPAAEEKANQEARDLIEQLSSRETLNPFVSNPLLLTLAAIVHTQLGRLPRYRARLYDVACQTLVDAWAQIRRTGDPASMKERIDYETEGLRVLPPLALWFHRYKPGGLAPRSEVVKQIARHLPKTVRDPDLAATKFLNGLTQAGALLLDRGNDQWGFAHQTFQEYLAAKSLAVSEAGVYRRELRSRLYDVRYAEVWRFLAGDLSVTQQRSKAASQFIRSIFRDRDKLQAALLRKNVLLAVGCLSDSVLADDELSEQITGALIELVLSRSLLPPEEAVSASLHQLRGTPDANLCIQRLVQVLGTDNDPEVLSSAASALGQLGAREVTPQIAPLLTDKDLVVRWHAAQALGQLGAQEAAPQIAALLTDNESWVRSSAAYALGQLGAREAAPQIAALLTNKESEVRWSAASALGQLGAKEVAPQIAALLTNNEPGVRSSAARALGQLGAREAAPQIVALLADKNADVRSNAADALGQLGAREIVPQIAALLTDNEPEVRWSAAHALGKLGAREAAPQIAALLTDNEPGFRSSAADALGKLGAREAAPQIAALLTDKELGVIWGVADVLASLGHTASIPQIRIALEKETDRYGRESLAKALWQLSFLPSEKRKRQVRKVRRVLKSRKF